VANGKKRKNIIFCLQKDEKSIVEDEKILEHATMYYKDLFGPSENPTFKLDSSCWDEQDKVTQEENDLLCRPYTLDEIQTVIFSLKKILHLDQIIFQWSFIKTAGRLSKRILWICSWSLKFTI